MLLQIGDAKIKHVQKFKCLGIVLIEGRKGDTEFQRCIGISKSALQKLCKGLRNRKFLFKTKTT